MKAKASPGEKGEVLSQMTILIFHLAFRWDSYTEHSRFMLVVKREEDTHKSRIMASIMSLMLFFTWISTSNALRTTGKAQCSQVG